MKFMTERVAREGRALNEDVLLVDCFLNHQVDMDLMRQCGEAFAERFRDKGITRVLTVESSGIAPAGEAALGVARLVEEAGSEVAGIGIVIEKSFQPGRGKLEAAGYDVFSLARVKAMSEGKIEFVEE